MQAGLTRLLVLVFAISGAALGVSAAELQGEVKPIGFASPWTSPYHVDPRYPYHLVNAEGRHLFILNKTAWAYFGCKEPEGVLRRARAQGITVLRVALEGTPYKKDLHLDLWPWGGTRETPEWSSFNEVYWREVERRVRLAGEAGLGLDVVLYFTLHPGNGDIAQQRPYWAEALRRLGRYANVLTWEIENENLNQTAFQDAAGEFFAQHDPARRPVCSSDGTTDDAAWPDKAWVGLAINHTCTSSTPRHGLRAWYLALARNTRAHGKPAWCNESGREMRHKNDDPVHRRKQAWLWNAAGCFWTHHAWDGCEGIDDSGYHAPGEQFMKPLAEFFQALPFWTLAPNETALVVTSSTLVSAALADPERSLALVYVCTEGSGAADENSGVECRLPPGRYEVRFVRPADGQLLDKQELRAEGVHRPKRIALPRFTDDLVIVARRLASGKPVRMPGTE